MGQQTHARSAATAGLGAEAAYLSLYRSGALAERAQEADARLHACDLCAHHCRVDRSVSLRGVVCKTGVPAVVHSYGPHHGEEDPLRGVNGSGTIFFSWCNLRCDYCQNWEISREGVGRAVSTDALAGMMLELQAQGCHNINFVSPSHLVAQILAAVLMAAEQGLHLPLVYNTGGYDSLEALALLDGVIDIYMPDLKYGDADLGRRYSHIREYPARNWRAVREMHRQVGDLVLDDAGIARRGLLVRHLVLPHGQAGTRAVLRFLAEEISLDTYLNVMPQYRPAYRAHRHPALEHPLAIAEYREALAMARELGFRRLDGRRA